MFRFKRAGVITAVTCCLSYAWASPNAISWRFEDVLRLASAKVDREDTSVRNARLELEMLRALGKTRVELRPNISLYSFSNPVLLAASIGSSLSVNRRTAPPAVSLALARLAVVHAEIGHAKSRIDAQVEATRHFFALTEAQDVEKVSCNMWQQQNGAREELTRLIALKRRTRLDMVRFEQDTNAFESACLEARVQIQEAALALGRVVGVKVPTHQLIVVTDDLSRMSVPAALPDPDELMKAAFESQEDLKALPEHIAQLADSRVRHSARFDSVTVGYAYLKNAQNGPQQIAKEYLLGGNTGHLDGGFYLPLRKTGADEATAAFLQARFDGLQRELEVVTAALRNEVEANVIKASTASSRLRIARKREALAKELHALTAIRDGKGLQTEMDEAWEKRAAAHASVDALRAELEWRQSVFTILALCEPNKVASSTSLRASAAASERRNITSLLAEPSDTRGDEWGSAGRVLDLKAPTLPVKDIYTGSVVPQPGVERVVTVVTPFGGEGWQALPTPPIATALDVAEINQQIQNALPSPQLPRSPNPVMASNPPAPAPAETTVVSEESQGTSYVPPRIARQNLALLLKPGPGFPIIRKDTNLSVQVNIDEGGRVTDAVALHDGTIPLNIALRSRAVAAAKQCTFVPARMHGKPMRSSCILLFKFRAQG